MHRHHFTLTFAAVTLLFSTAVAPAQSSSQSTKSTAKSALHAPIPPAIAAAKTVFLSNAGADSSMFPSSYSGLERSGPFCGTPRRGYDEFYADLAKSGRFHLVHSPSAADLVLELRLLSPGGIVSYNKINGPGTPPPMFRLVIRDRRTHYILWTLTQSIHGAILQRTSDRNFDSAIHELATQFLDLAGKAPAATP